MKKFPFYKQHDSMDCGPAKLRRSYAVEILFPNELISSYGKKLEYIHQMSGTADIITKDMRLIEQFIQPIRAVIDNLSK